MLRKLSELNCLAKSDLKVVASKASCFVICFISLRSVFTFICEPKTSYKHACSLAMQR